jgi:DNA-binding MarR family transcriptional regulator
MTRNHVGHGRDVSEDREFYVPEQRSLLAISRVLEETARMLHDWALADDPPLRRPDDRPMPVTAATVRTLIAARWLRRDFLGHDAGDPEWSLMLELYAARLEGREVHQTGLSVAAGVAQSTALQATRRLVEAGLFATRPDPRDGRKLLVALTAQAAERIRSYLTAALEIGSPLV